MAIKSKRGRKPKPKGQKQTARFVLYLTPAQARLLKKDCSDRDMTASMFLTDLWLEWRAVQEK